MNPRLGSLLTSDSLRAASPRSVPGHYARLAILLHLRNLTVANAFVFPDCEVAANVDVRVAWSYADADIRPTDIKRDLCDPLAAHVSDLDVSRPSAAMWTSGGFLVHPVIDLNVVCECSIARLDQHWFANEISNSLIACDEVRIDAGDLKPFLAAVRVFVDREIL